jgi:hypothetical protein
LRRYNERVATLCARRVAAHRGEGSSGGGGGCGGGGGGGGGGGSGGSGDRDLASADKALERFSVEDLKYIFAIP